MGILMRGVKRDEVTRGMIVAKPGTLKQHDRFKAQIYMMTKEEGGREKPLTNNLQGRIFFETFSWCFFCKSISFVPLSSLRQCILIYEVVTCDTAKNKASKYFMQLAAYSKTWDCSTYVTIEGGKDLFMPGEDGTIVARLVKPQVLEVGQTFTLRDGKHTVGTGKVRFVGSKAIPTCRAFIHLSLSTGHGVQEEHERCREGVSPGEQEVQGENGGEGYDQGGGVLMGVPHSSPYLWTARRARMTLRLRAATN